MCLIAVAVEPPGPWLLVVAANRDEFHDRAAAPAAYWTEGRDDRRERSSLGVFAGRDLQGGGTWLGMRRCADDAVLRIGALTNLRPGLMPAPAVPPAAGLLVPPSRGRLVADYLAAEVDPGAFLAALQPSPQAYAGFNLLTIRLQAAGPAADAWYLNNLPGSRPRRLAAGLHLVSNATLDVPWPKTRRLQAAMTRALVGPHDPDSHDTDSDQASHGEDPRPGHPAPALQALERALLDALADPAPAPEAELPQTGLERERERLLSAPFIVDDHYGTRCSTVIGVCRSGQVFYAERSFGPGGRLLGTVRERFDLRRAGQPA
jgi:uncharacterized protein with NRDE domain